MSGYTYGYDSLPRKAEMTSVPGGYPEGHMLLPDDSASNRGSSLPHIHPTHKRAIAVHTTGPLGFGCFAYPGYGLVICDLAPGGHIERTGIQIGDILVTANGLHLARNSVDESLDVIRRCLPTVELIVEGFVRPEEVHLLEEGHDSSDDGVEDEQGVQVFDGSRVGYVYNSNDVDDSSSDSSDDDTSAKIDPMIADQEIDYFKGAYGQTNVDSEGHTAQKAIWLIALIPILAPISFALLWVATAEAVVRYIRSKLYMLTGPSPAPPLSGENLIYDIIVHIWYVILFGVEDGGLKHDLHQSQGGIVLTTQKAEILTKDAVGSFTKNLLQFRGTRIVTEMTPSASTAHNVAAIIEGRANRNLRSKNLFQPGLDDDRCQPHIDAASGKSRLFASVDGESMEMKPVSPEKNVRFRHRRDNAHEDVVVNATLGTTEI